jgi:BirA family biotin operon repressor/biotin-[acetyl-CoA-carboxylase] ligase
VTPDQPSRPPLDAAALARPPWRVEVVEESPSTNADVARRARDGEPAGLVVVTEHQTAGRGRLDRVWVTPPRAALTFSLLVTPGRVPTGRWPWLPLLAGLAVVEAVTDVAGVPALLKWPNDVLVDDRKVAGILVELVERGSGAAAVVGVGLNVSSTREELPVETATSLELAGAGRVDRSALLGGVLDRFTQLYDAWVGAEGEGLRPAYARRCATIGRDVRVDLPTGQTLQGRALDVDDEGRLLVDDGGHVHALGAGDVVHVRPAGTPPA